MALIQCPAWWLHVMHRLYSEWCNIATERYDVFFDGFEGGFADDAAPGAALVGVLDDGLAAVFNGVPGCVGDVTAAGDCIPSFFSNFVRISPTRVARAEGAKGF